jgi:peptide/nickel transport system permease protein
MDGSTRALATVEAGAAAPTRARGFSPGLEAWRRFRRHRLALERRHPITMVLAITLGSFVACRSTRSTSHAPAGTVSAPLGTDDLGQTWRA